jgi:hypothetical protein
MPCIMIGAPADRLIIVVPVIASCYVRKATELQSLGETGKQLKHCLAVFCCQHMFGIADTAV